MSHFQVRAESVDGALMTFGFQAPDTRQARKRVLDMLPFDPHFFVVRELEVPLAREDSSAPQLDAHPPAL